MVQNYLKLLYYFSAGMVNKIAV